MKTKLFFFLFVSLLLVGTIQARTNIPLVKDVPSGGSNDDRARDAVPPPTAYIEENILKISLMFSYPLTATITGENKECLFKKDFPANHDFYINLKENGIHEGDYTLNIFYQYNWWRGEFTFGTKKPTPTADGSIVEQGYVYYRVDGTNATVTGLIRNKLEPERSYPDAIVIPSQFTYWGVTYDVKGIENKAFKNCTFTSAKLPESIEFIGDSAFAYCTNLQSIDIPDKVTDIGRNAFEHCSALSSATIPEGISTIKAGTFLYCSRLTSVTLPTTLETIEEKAFRYCRSLPSIVIPEGVTYIASHAFENCLNLKSIELPSSIHTIEARCFFQCLSLTDIVIPEGVEEIMPQAFRYCVRLSSISLPESLTRIDKRAFEKISDAAHIYCHAKKPCEIYATTFSHYKYILHGPVGCKEMYQNDNIWSNFLVIVEDIRLGTLYDVTGFEPVELCDDAVESTAYDLTGRPADITQKGIYIVNGKKVLVK